MNIKSKIAKLVAVGVLATSLMACDAPTIEVNGTVYRDYGLLDQDKRDPKIEYEPNWYNIVLGCLFFQLIFPPIYVFGFHLMEPVDVKPTKVK